MSNKASASYYIASERAAGEAAELQERERKRQGRGG